MPPRVRTAPRKKPRQGRSVATVDAILDATARVLKKIGYDRASTNRVALAAGVSVGSLYQYFPSKEALVAALAERHMTHMMAIVRSKVAEVAGAPVPVAVRTIIMGMFEAHTLEPGLHKVLIEQVPRIGRLENLHQIESETQTMIADLLEARRSEIRPRAPCETIAFVLVHAVEAVTHAVMTEELPPAQASAVADELTELVLRYLAP
jgi:AcrR family transcriptional regulator